MIKRIIGILISICILLSSASCSGTVSENENATEAEPQNTSSSDENIKYLPLSDVITYCSGNEKRVIDYNTVFATDNNGVTEISDFQNEKKGTFSESVLPFSIRIGDSFTDVCSSVQLESGYAMCGVTGGSPERFDKEKTVDFPSGQTGTLYFGYKVDGDQCTPIEYTYLLAILSGSMMSYKQFDIVMYSMNFDSDEKLMSALTVYCDFGAFTSIVKE